MHVKVLLTCLLLSGLLVGCGQSRRAWIEEDEWYNPRSSEAYLEEWKALDRDRFHEVVESELPRAEEMLRDVSSVALSDEEAADFVGEPLPAAVGTQPYLVRGLLLVRATGAFRVLVREDQVVVHHGSLGRGSSRMSRQPLVLQLQQSPQVVYVSVSMAE